MTYYNRRIYTGDQHAALPEDAKLKHDRCYDFTATPQRRIDILVEMRKAEVDAERDYHRPKLVRTWHGDSKIKRTKHSSLAADERHPYKGARVSTGGKCVAVTGRKG